MRRVGGDDRVALVGLATIGEVRAHEHQARQLPLRARGRLKRAGVQARHLDQRLLQPPHQLERALDRVFVLVGMEVPEAGHHRQALVDPRVVLHRAGAEGIKARVDAEVACRELREVPDELRLRELGKPRRRLSLQLVGHLRTRNVVARQLSAAAAGLRLLEDQLHVASASTRRSMSAGVRRSVTATSSASSNPARSLCQSTPSLKSTIAFLPLTGYKAASAISIAS